MPKLADLRTKVREIKQYLAKTDSGELRTEVFVCHHDSNGTIPDGERLEI